MHDRSVEFASLLCSRLCHDLLSPVGAMNNGLELLADEDDPDMRLRVMELLADSAQASADKLKFFRLAFGAAGGFDEQLPAGEVQAALAGLVRTNPRLELGWMVEGDLIAKSAAKLLLNLAMVAFDALVRGGRILAAVDGDEVVVRAEGLRVVLDAEIRAVLQGGGDADQVTSRSAAAWLIRFLADADGRTLRLAQEEGVLLLAAVRG
jgi:histidine phosphotransferase ChpT